MRDSVMIQLMDRVMQDNDFRQRMVADLDGTLLEAGIELSEDEMAAVREFHASVAGMSDAELEEALTTTSRRQHVS